MSGIFVSVTISGSFVGGQIRPVCLNGPLSVELTASKAAEQVITLFVLGERLHFG